MKLSLFSIIGGTFYKFSDVPITKETLRQFEEEVSSKVSEKLAELSPLLPLMIKITPELVVSEEHNGDVMVKDIILEAREMAKASSASLNTMAGSAKETEVDSDESSDNMATMGQSTGDRE